MKKTLQVLCIMSLFMLCFSFVNNHSAEAASPKKAYVAAESVYSGGGNSSKSRGIDLFMGPKDAAIYASKLNSSWKASVAWAAAGFIPGVGPFITGVGVAETVKSQQAAKKIEKLAKKNKKVHVFTQDGLISVKEWDGKASSIKTSMPKSSTQKMGNIRTSIKTKILKKVVK
ncbi:hypothetical protein AC623_15905 [Bacillus sp. FJAT-27231]|uniref:hypothetical protein n=1 Tax=Bacillus sp. FJAT-27231 TaxID=1679168 RepID=UPI00067156C2|nr:hypothetical protein [Bacillus sp. FJAT-27231]KMY55227.1 hypothetical protein AC623_15905 [Bacillus sp. FJAT-27231]